MKDFVEICQIDSRVEQDESGEKEFFEISEYVRIGVLNLYAELNQPAIEPDTDLGTKEPASRTLH